MSEQETKWYRAKKGGQVGVIPDIGVHDPATPIPVRNPEHEARILASGLYEEAPAPKVKAEPQPEAPAPTLADAAAAATTTLPPTDDKGGKK